MSLEYNNEPSLEPIISYIMQVSDNVNYFLHMNGLDKKGNLVITEKQLLNLNKLKEKQISENLSSYCESIKNIVKEIISQEAPNWVI